MNFTYIRIIKASRKEDQVLQSYKKQQSILENEWSRIQKQREDLIEFEMQTSKRRYFCLFLF